MKTLCREIHDGVFSLVVCLLTLGASAATAVVDQDCAGMGEVTWSESRKPDGNSQLTVKAKAKAGYAFVGWSVLERDVVEWPADLRYPGELTATVTSNAVVAAQFLPSADDALSFDIADAFGDEIECGEAIQQVIDVDSASFPTLTFRGLPKGLEYDAPTLTLFGTPSEPGVYQVEATGVNGSGYTFSSFSTVRVLDLEGARVSGSDTEIPLGEYFYSEIGGGDISDIFSFAEDPTFVKLSGSVPGLEWDEEWRLLYGTPTAPGAYTLKVTASFPTGAVETATLLLSVVGADPYEYGLDFDILSNLQVGDELDDTNLIGSDSEDAVIKGVSGLPKGLKAAWRYEDGARRWFVSGTVGEPGFNTVTVQVEDRSDETQRVVKVVQTVVVADLQDVYLPVKSYDESMGTVTGGGAVSPMDSVTLVAKPNSGYVFSGWYDTDGSSLVLREGVDYRTRSITLPAGTDFAFLEPVAHFTAKADDEAPDLSELDEAEYQFNPQEAFAETFSVDSHSLPTLTFKGLPNGVTCTADGTGGFVLAYYPEVATAASARYQVSVTAVNVSGKKSSATFRITVEPQSDERIHVDSDYGEFAPGEEIDPIDLSDAVDFEGGETLSVSGLPRGLVYNAKANAKKGIEAHTITGTPTVPGDYTLAFSAKVVSGSTTNRQGKVSPVCAKATATAFVTILPYPELEIEIDDDAAEAGCKVKGAGNYKAGTKVSLQAKAAKGWVFTEWEGLDEIEGLAARNPTLSYVTGEEDVWIRAGFTTIDQDGLWINPPDLSDDGYAAEWERGEPVDEDDANLIADLINTVSWPTVKVDGLPSGVKFSAATFQLSGAPKKSGVYHVTVTAKNAGGYSFVRVFDIAVLNADGTMPTEKELVNAAEIDFLPLKGLTTGVYCPTGSVVLAVGTKPGTGSAVAKASASGLPSGLVAGVSLVDGGAEMEITGTPTKPGRFVVTVSVTYADRKTLKSQAAIVIEDGGSQYLFVTSDNLEIGTVTGEGVYASGEKVKLVAKPKSKFVFAGWQVADEHGDIGLFEPLRDRDGIDPRTASVVFPFRPLDFHQGYELAGTFTASTNDYAAIIEVESDSWGIDPAQPSSFAFAVDSLSVPKVSVTGLPKGVTVDTVRGRLTYTPTASATPGIYTAKISAKNVTQRQPSVQTVEVRVANRVSDVIDGLNPDMDAYPLSVGVTLDPTLIAPTVDDGWTLSVKGLPSGLSFKNGALVGFPTKSGDYTVTFIATSGTGKDKKTETATITLRIYALPLVLCGTYTGALYAEDGTITGMVTITTTSAGKVSVSAKTSAKSYTFTKKSWDVYHDGSVSVAMQDKSGVNLELSIADTTDWRSWQATGALKLNEMRLTLSAQRNPYGTKDGDAEARQLVAAMVGNSTYDGWKIKLTSKGIVTFSGKYAGKAYSGSAVLQIDEGQFFARYVKIIDKKSILILVFYFDDAGRVCDCSIEKH